ncbi:MAG TPA: linear amide C-N hydrolase [Nostocaceae cyanobacterium]|nr:linear amide C-N hydrolase [Nostocaceae cyanobacterium]
MCTRILYSDNTFETTSTPNVVTGRNMDWGSKTTFAEFWLFPVGMNRVGLVSEKIGDFTPFTWTSKYGSVVISGYNAGTSDGINTQGLVANLLFLSVAEFPASKPGERLMSTGAWPQYLLDTCATVEEAVKTMEDLEKENIRIVELEIPGREGRRAGLHLCVSDATGNSAIFEYKDGKLVIYHGKQYTVMTNEPFYDEQLAMNEYWQRRNKDSLAFLPGTQRADDRFARASYYLSQVERNVDTRTAVAIAFSIIRNVTVPLRLKNTNPDLPSQAETIWSTVIDQKNRVYYYLYSLNPAACWINLDELDFSVNSGVRKIPALESNFKLGGDITDQFKPAEPFEFTDSPQLPISN